MREHVRVVGGDAAHGAGAETISLVPLAAGNERLDDVGDKHRRIAAVAAHDLQAELSDPGGLVRALRHHQHVGEGHVGNEQIGRVSDGFGELERLS